MSAIVARGILPIFTRAHFALLLAVVLLPACSSAAQTAVGTQPNGSLSGKVVYVHAGHGWTAENLGDGSWATQRPLLYQMVEDLGNQDGITFLVDYLWRAGATIAPQRPVGHQANEVVIDNDDAEVQFTGAWTDSTETVYFGDAADVPFRYAAASPTETATATYTPNISETGFYPVYAWAAHGADRVRQFYRVHHSGGATEVTVDHRRVGSGTVYLGTFHFEAGTNGSVEISNRSDDAGIVIADMIRFGNGMGDINRGGGVSGKSREDEAGLYWVKWHVDRCQGIPESEYRATDNDRNATVSLSPRYSEYMNREATGTLSDRVFISYHSNAGTGASRGVLGLLNGNNNPATATPNMFLLADTVASEVNDDLVALAGEFEHDWHDRGSNVTLDRSDIEFGEINNLYINNEFDATIIETGFHDNQQDAEMLRDARVRNALARSTYQGLIKYFNAVDGGATPLAMAPGPVTDGRAIGNGDGTVTLSWTPPTVNGQIGDAPTGYRIYTSPNGYGFDGGIDVPGGATTSHLLSGLNPADGTHYFTIVAVNDAGESPRSPVFAATPYAGASSTLIVNGFDRLDRTMNVRQVCPGFGTIDRVWPRHMNSFDYSVQVGEAIEFAAPGRAFDCTENEPVINGDVLLNDYTTVIWIVGEESSADSTLNAAEQALLTTYINAGGDLIISGSEIGWDLDFLNNGRDFYLNTLRAIYIADDSNTYDVQGAPGSIFDGLTFSFDDGTEFYDVNYPDVIGIDPNGYAAIALTYDGGTGGGAAIQYQGTSGEGDIVMLAFPFETILGEQNRADVMAAMLDFIAPPCPADTDGNRTVDVVDLLAVLTNWGTCGSCNADTNADGFVDVLDLLGVLSAWGRC